MQEDAVPRQVSSDSVQQGHTLLSYTGFCGHHRHLHGQLVIS